MQGENTACIESEQEHKGPLIFYRTKICPAQCGWIIINYNQ